MLNVDSDDYIVQKIVGLMIKKMKEDGSEIMVCDYNTVSKGGIRVLSNDKYECISKMLIKEI